MKSFSLDKQGIYEYQQNREPYLLIDYASEIIPGVSSKGYKDLKNDETALVVAHDAVNKTILCHLLGLTPSEIWMIKQGNGGITIIDLSEKENQPDQITCLNITSHLGGIIDLTAAGAL